MFHEESKDSLKALATSDDYNGNMARTELNRRSELEQQALLARQAAEQAAKQLALANIKGSSYDVKIGTNGVPVSIYNGSETMKYQNISNNSTSSFPKFSFSQITNANYQVPRNSKRSKSQDEPLIGKDWFYQNSTGKFIFDNVLDPFKKGVDYVLDTTPGKFVDLVSQNAAIMAGNPQFEPLSTTNNKTADKIASTTGKVMGLFTPIGVEGGAVVNISASGIKIVAKDALNTITDFVKSKLPAGKNAAEDIITQGTGEVGGTRPTWRQSEIDASTDYPGYMEQQSFKDGDPSSHGTSGSSRPDLYTDGHSIEVKNYNVTTSSVKVI